MMIGYEYSTEGWLTDYKKNTGDDTALDVFEDEFYNKHYVHTFIKCLKCKKGIISDSKYCSYCGEKI